MIPRSLLILARCVPLLLVFPVSLSAQWTGLGAGGAGTDFNDTANWTGGVVNGNFSGNTASATIALSGDITLSGLNFAWAESNLALVINGNGSGANEVITLNGDITVRRAATGTASATFGSDVTLDFGTFSSTRGVAASGSGSNYGSVIINGLVTGTATGTAALEFGKSSLPVSVRLLNDNNSFTAPIIANGALSFTSVANVGGGASALGSATTVANGTITLKRNAQLNYIGTTDQTTDRRIVIDGGAGPVSINHAGTTGKLTYTSEIAGGTYANVLNLRVGPVATGTSDAVMEISGAITNAGGGAMSLNVNASGNNGTLILSNAANTYKGRTVLTGGSVLEVVKLANGSEASSIGASSSDAGNLIWGDWGDRTMTLRYVGAGDSTDRLFTVPRTARIESSGTGALKFTNTGAIEFGTNTTYGRSLMLGGTNTGDNTLAAAIGDYAPAVAANSSRTTSLAKSGSGKWILTGTNTYTGATTVSAGTLLVDGSLTSAVTVSAGVFGGAGSTTGAVVIGNSSDSRDSVFLAGAGTGNFTTTSTLEFKSDAEFAYAFDSSGTGAGFVTANGITINSSAYFTFTDTGDGSGVSLNDSITLLRNTGASIAGTFVNLADNGEFTVNGITWRASYSGGAGADLVLTAVSLGAIPEPGSLAAWLGAAGLFVAGAMRPRRHDR